MTFPRFYYDTCILSQLEEQHQVWCLESKLLQVEFGVVREVYDTLDELYILLNVLPRAVAGKKIVRMPALSIMSPMPQGNESSSCLTSYPCFNRRAHRTSSQSVRFQDVLNILERILDLLTEEKSRRSSGGKTHNRRQLTKQFVQHAVKRVFLGNFHKVACVILDLS